MLALEELGVERLWPRTEPRDRHNLLLLGEVDHDRRNTGDIDEITLQHPERDPGGAPRIDGIASRLEDVEAGGRCKIMACRDRVPGHGDGRPMRGCLAHGVPLPDVLRTHSSA